MRVLTLNPGSSSLKATLVENGTAVGWANWEMADPAEDSWVVADAVHRWPKPDAVAVRFVHGGSRAEPAVVEADLLRALARLIPLAPLHQPLSLAVARSVTELLPEVPVVACFDTSFHTELPPAASHYALPREWTRQGRLRRYGFHGLSCQYIARRTPELVAGASRILCCHLGAGVSVTAIRDGHSVDTSMGFTPLEGPAMATRSGSVDPGLLLHVLKTAPMSAEDMEEALYRRSGLAGMSGTSGDLRVVLAAAETGDHDSELAIEVYLHGLRRAIGSMATSLDHLDAVVFTGGVTDHQPELIERLANGLSVLGVGPVRVGGAGDRVISAPGARVAAMIVRTREDLELARGAELALARVSA
ncbi:acetate/propionate family kinase [Amycolatopsis sp. NPDC059657]|uniref:acetate/propionate family kinase n=1 Tax=Amycolatopsis sp. NPDC059657 TaxID=3346899 RepID=UPI00366C0341